MADHDDGAVLDPPSVEFAFPLGKHWRVGYVLEVHDGAAVVTELHITPWRMRRRPKPGVEDLSPTDAWEADPDYIPARGLTARELRGVSLGPEVTAFALRPERVPVHDPETGEVVRSPETRGGLVYREVPTDFSKAVTQARTNARGYGRPDVFYAEIAAMYLKAIESGSGRPIHDIADELKAHGQPFAPESIRIFRRTAIKRGLLTPSPRPGVAGGRLTERAEELLRDAADGSA